MTASFIVALVIYAFILYKSWSDTVDDIMAALPMAITGIVIFFILYTFRNLSIVLYDDRLQFGFGFFKKTIRRGEIINIEKKEFKFRNYLGYGIRRGLDKSWGYIVGGEQGLMVYIQGKKFYFNTDNPDELLQLIKQQLM